MIQKIGRKMPMRNMIQWPFLIAVIPSTTNSTM